MQRATAEPTETTPANAPFASRTPHRNRKRALGKWLKRLVWAIIGLGIAGFIVLAWLPKPVPVDTEVVRRGVMRITVDDSGRTRVKDRHIVSAPITGNLARLEHRPNDTVERSAVLARIAPLAPVLLDPRTKAETAARLAGANAAGMQARASLERARLAAENAIRDLDRAERLAQSGAISAHALEQARLERRLRAEELASAEFAMQVAEHEVELVRATLRRFSGGTTDEFAVTSPARGRVLKVFQESAGVVQAGTALLEIGDPTALEIVTDVLTADAVHIEPGASVVIDRWGGDAPLAGHVRLVEPSAFTRMSALGIEEQRVKVIIDLDDPQVKWAALGDGYRVETRIIVWQADGVVTVPSSAAFRRGDGWFVFVVEGDVARLRSVEVGKRNDSQVEVRAGVDEGAIVIVHPSERVVDAQRVERR